MVGFTIAVYMESNMFQSLFLTTVGHKLESLFQLELSDLILKLIGKQNVRSRNESNLV
jgi:hypothetical protein